VAKLDQDIKKYKKNLSQTKSMVGNNEVIIVPSPHLPPLDMIPRVMILDEFNFKKSYKKKRYVEES
jgi:hypothetical protein